MEHVRKILVGAQPASGRSIFPVIWSEARREQLRRTASGEIVGYSSIDRVVSQYLLFCADGQFDDAEIGILDVLRYQIDVLPKDGEVFLSLLNALFVVQRLDLVGAMLRDRFGFPGDVNIALSDAGVGSSLLQWNISPSGEHSFVFDAAALRDDNTRNEILNFYWEFPLFVHYAEQGEKETGSVLFNRTDIGQKPGLAYCDNRPDYFLIPDAGFVPSQGYRWSRQVYDKNRIPWQDRSPVAFWRGATTGMKPEPREWRALERIKLCEIARAHRHTGLFDVGISGLTQIFDPEVAKEIIDSGLVLGRIPWEDWGRYKYLIIIDGNSSPYSNLIQALLTGSPVLRVESSRALKQWFYSELIPWHNYIPIAPDMSDLLDKVQWLRRNDEFAQKVGENGRAFAETMTIERELQRSVPVISAAFRYFRDPSAYILPYGMPLPPTGAPSVASASKPQDDPRPDAVAKPDTVVVVTASAVVPSQDLIAPPPTARVDAPINHTARRANALAIQLGGRRYLQIGVSRGAGFHDVKIAERTGVDPDFALDIDEAANESTRFVKLTSDAFFANESRLSPYDVVVIDGLHTFEQVVRDLSNVLLCTHDRSAIILDDIVPEDVYSSVKDNLEADRHRKKDGAPDRGWQGDVFKAIFYIHDFWPSLNYRTITGGANSQTLVWRANGVRRTPVFDDLEQISRLTYFDLKEHLAVLQPATEDEAIALCIAEIKAL
jgi:hypothetical protein